MRSYKHWQAEEIQTASAVNQSPRKEVGSESEGKSERFINE